MFYHLIRGSDSPINRDDDGAAILLVFLAD